MTSVGVPVQGALLFGRTTCTLLKQAFLQLADEYLDSDNSDLAGSSANGYFLAAMFPLVGCSSGLDLSGTWHAVLCAIAVLPGTLMSEHLLVRHYSIQFGSHALRGAAVSFMLVIFGEAFFRVQSSIAQAAAVIFGVFLSFLHFRQVAISCYQSEAQSPDGKA